MCPEVEAATVLFVISNAEPAVKVEHAHDVGMEDASSAMLSPMKRIRPPAKNHPQFIATGPP